MSKYNTRFVLISEKLYGVFTMDADSYPEEFLDNIKNVEVMDESDVPSYLLKNVRLNTLSKSHFNLYTDCGKIFYR